MKTGKNTMINVGIAGASGYTGIELVRLICNHPQARVAAITSGTHSGKSLTQVFESLQGFDSLIFEDLDFRALAGRVDIMFLALPHKVSMAHAPDLLAAGIRVVDLSADFRFRDPARYEAAYQKHTALEWLKKSVYGLTEIYRDQIRSAHLVGNPGCYPTSILLPLIPLLKEGLIQSAGIVADAKSGVSGAGRSLSLTTHFCEVNESFTPYKVGNHRHVPEIEEVLSIQAQQPVCITFVPHLVPVTRGMVSTLYTVVTDGVTESRIRETYDRWYAQEPFVKLLPPGKFPGMSQVRGTNRCDMGCHLDPLSGRLILISAIDNLVKGAAGQAIQNMNCMLGLPETLGLDFVQSPV
jgi:N-acetyl-gamma-glutamyl-phosphate reductase